MARKNHSDDVRPRRRRSWRRLRWALGLPAVLIAVAWAAPWIAVKCGVVDRAVADATADFSGTVKFGSVSLGWFSPVRAADVAVLDEQGRPLLDVPSVVTDKSLLGLVWDHRHLGTIRVDRPELFVALRPDGSNVEDAIESLLAGDDTSAVDAGFLLEVAEAVVHVDDRAAGRTWQIDGLNVRLTASPKGPASLSAAGNVHWGGRSSRVSADWLAPGGELQLAVKTEDLPLELADTLLRRFAPGANVSLAGRATSDLKCGRTGGDDEPVLSIEGQLAIARPVLAGGMFAGDDRLTADSLTSTGKATLTGSRLDVESLRVESDLADVALSGTVYLDRLDPAAGAPRGSQALGLRPARLDGDVDLARLAAMLPNTLRIRSGTTIESGSVTFQLETQSERSGRRWSGRIETTNVLAAADGRSVSWDRPLSLDAVLVESLDSVTVERLTCESIFLQATARGTPEEGGISVEADLDRLAREAAKLVDLEGIQLAGRLAGEVQWTQSAGERSDISADLLLERFVLSTAAEHVWREDRLAVALAATGSVNEHGLRTIETGTLQITSSGDRLDAALLRPVVGAGAAATWPVECRLAGSIEAWTSRLGPWIGTGGWQLGGAIDARAAVEMSPEKIVIENASGEAQQLAARNGETFLFEPIVRFQGGGTWLRKAGRWTSPDLTWAGTALSVRASDVDLAFPPDGKAPVLAGQVAFRGDVGRMAAWTQKPNEVPKTRWSGQLNGRLILSHEGGVTRFQSAADLERLACVPVANPSNGPADGVASVDTATAAPIWAEQRLALAGSGTYDHRGDLLELTQLRAEGTGMRLAAAGRILSPRTTPTADMSGQIDYDLPTLAQHYRSLLGPGVELTGTGSRQFTVTGPLREMKTEAAPGGIAATMVAAGRPAPGNGGRSPLSPALKADGTIGWDAASVYGFVVGRGELVGRLSGGVVRFDPLDVILSEGRLTAAPSIDLNGRSAVLTIPKGPVFTAVRTSPEMCRTWLKYVAPLTAEATQIDGTLSMQMDAARVPLADPEGAALAGTLRIDSLRVGPGPLAREFLLLARQIQAIVDGRPLAAVAGTSGAPVWMTADRHDVPFELADRRVYHRGLEMNIDGVVVRTEGSVGVDQTLDMVATVPIQDEWLRRNRLLAGFKGQSIQVPVGGTLKAPALDRRVLNQLAGQLVGGAAERLIQDELGRQLDRFFTPPGAGPAGP